MSFYNSPEIDRAVDAVVTASDGLGLPRVEVLALVAQRFGEQLARSSFEADLQQAADELGIDLSTASLHGRCADCPGCTDRSCGCVACQGRCAIY